MCVILLTMQMALCSARLCNLRECDYLSIIMSFTFTAKSHVGHSVCLHKDKHFYYQRYKVYI